MINLGAFSYGTVFIVMLIGVLGIFMEIGSKT